MESINYKPVLAGYIKAVLLSLLLLLVWITASTSFDDWFFFVYILVAFVGTMFHFIFLLLMFLLIYPLITRKELFSGTEPFKSLMEKYTPYLAIPVGTLIILLWITGNFNPYFTLIILDMLFTSYIGLYFYLKNKIKYHEIS